MIENKPSPLQILMTEFLQPAQATALEAQVAKIQEPPRVTALGDLHAPVYGNDPTELLKHRFVYRGATCLLCGPTGVGKSARLMHAAIRWSVGKSFFGIEPGDVYQRQGMRILLVQAENDEGDLAEMRDGVLAGCDDLTDAEQALAKTRIDTCTICDKVSDVFVAELDVLLTEGGPYDLVMVDPAFAYLGGDSKSQKEVGHFMRELLHPLLQKHKVGLVLAHHTNKPLRGKEKDSWEAGDFAYLGAGSAEWINPARAALAIRSVGSDSVFEFRAIKRGKRLRWTDANGNPTTVKLIAHDPRPGVICWHPATPAEIAEVTREESFGRPKSYNELEVLHAVRAFPGKSQRGYVGVLSDVLGCGFGTAVGFLKKCVRAGWLREAGDARFRRYELTAEGEKALAQHPSAHDWRGECSTSVP